MNHYCLTIGDKFFFTYQAAIHHISKAASTCCLKINYIDRVRHHIMFAINFLARAKRPKAVIRQNRRDTRKATPLEASKIKSGTGPSCQSRGTKTEHIKNRTYQLFYRSQHFCINETRHNNEIFITIANCFYNFITFIGWRLSNHVNSYHRRKCPTA